MARKTEVPNLGDLIERYESGESLNSVSNDAPVSRGTLTRRFRDRGIEIRQNGGRERTSFDNVDRIVERYRAGDSVKQLSDELGRARSVVERTLREQGVEIRGNSDAEEAKWERIKDEGREAVERQLASAWEARREKGSSMSELRNRAKAREETLGVRMSPHEATLCEELVSRGYEPVRQKAVGVRNLDLAFPEDTVAVEVMGDEFPRPNSRHGQQIKYLLDRDWAVLGVRIPDESAFNPVVVCDKIISFRDLARRDESLFGKYGMIRGDGDPFARRSNDLDGRTVVSDF